MCKTCHKNKKCDSACVSLMRVAKKDLTTEEYQRVRTFESNARNDYGYGQ